MQKRLTIAAAAVLLLAAAGTAFAYRAVIRESVATRLKPDLPEARPYVPPAAEPEPAAGEPEAAPAPEAATPQPAEEPAAISPKPAPQVVVDETKGVNLAVPFTSQAPHADWSLPYQEACEEASLIMASAYFTGAASLPPDEADRQIKALVAWEEERFGYYEDTTAAEVATIAKEYYGFAGARAAEISSLDAVKREIDAGRPVLLPAAGRLLHNPYFSGEGPVYHMLLVKGYTKDGRIITNDPGTRRGADYLYDADVLWNAVHDWNGGDVEHGAKLMVAFGK